MTSSIIVCWDLDSEFCQLVVAGIQGKSRRWNPEAPLEALHYVWLALHRKYPEGEILDGPRLWHLHLLIKWRVANYFKTQRGRRSRQPQPTQIEGFDFSSMESRSAPPDQIASDRELIEKIQCKLAEMPPHWANAVRTHYGFPEVPGPSEIARNLGRTRQSAQKHYKKGLRELKIAFA